MGTRLSHLQVFPISFYRCEHGGVEGTYKPRGRRYTNICKCSRARRAGGIRIVAKIWVGTPSEQSEGDLVRRSSYITHGGVRG